jgi:hypothetical protein
MKKVFILSALAILILSLSACNLPIGTSNASQSDIKTAVAMNVALTQVAGTMTAFVVNNPPTETPQPIPPTSTNTPEPSFTPTQQGVWLTVKEDTNCRSGPGTFYDFVTLLQAGTKVEAVARNAANDYYYVHNPNGGASFCWLWDKWSDVSGNITLLTVFTPQPTPTPAFTNTPTAGFDVSYVGLVQCGPNYAVTIKITNTGSVTWKSYHLEVNDKTATISRIDDSDQFVAWNSVCMSQIDNQADLAPGESGMVTSPTFNFNIDNHELKISVTTYSKDGSIGTSASNSFKVKP